jgi:hypothetical protein
MLVGSGKSRVGTEGEVVAPLWYVPLKEFPDESVAVVGPAPSSPFQYPFMPLPVC